MDIETVIDRLGGLDAAARLTGVGTEAVRKWRQARSVPSRHWPAVIAATGLTLADLQTPTDASVIDTARPPDGATAALVLADGSVFWGTGFGAHTAATAPVGEVCFNTGMTGYQETLTDPSYAGQIITFTFPHIGNVGANAEDTEANFVAARGLVVKQDVTEPSNWRAVQTAAGLAAHARRRRHRRRGHPRADHPRPRRRRPDRRAGLPCRWPLRHSGAGRAGRRVAGPGGDGSGEGRYLPADLRMGPDALGVARRAPAERWRRATTSSPWITARSTTSCAALPPPAAG